MKIVKYNLIFSPEPEGGYTVTVPSLPGLVSYGKSLEEAKSMALDAMNGYIAVLRRHKHPIPSDADSFITQTDLFIPYTKTKSHTHA